MLAPLYLLIMYCAIYPMSRRAWETPCWPPVGLCIEGWWICWGIVCSKRICAFCLVGQGKERFSVFTFFSGTRRFIPKVVV